MEEENRCGGCTMCCELFPVKWLKKPALTNCVHCVLNKGCAIQETKDDECRQFDCAYIQSKNANINLRPDKCGIVFEKVSDNIFYGIIHPDYEINEIMKGQIQSFLSQGYTVIVKSFKEKNLGVFINDNHNSEEIKLEFNKILIEKYGSTEL